MGIPGSINHYLVKTEGGTSLGRWETEHPIRSGDVMIDGDKEWKALYLRHKQFPATPVLVVRAHI